ncbi:MAG: hypothetical protein MI866_23750 [Bacteroidales bacterium]|nr:hypothetical protein [Bacteroidales bacterium]
MSNLNRYIPYLLLGVYVTAQLLLLSVVTLPWFDETFFASITYNLNAGNGFTQTVMPLSDQTILTYGPVYFLLTKISTAIGGFNPFSFRIINLMAALLVALVLYKTLFRHSKYKSLLIVMLLLDPLYLLNAQTGRMDMLALLFAVFVYVPYWYKNQGTPLLLMASVLSTLALLTTPRIAFLLIPIWIYYSISLLKQKRYIVLLLCITLVVYIYSIWIFYAFWGYGNFIDYYTSTPIISNLTLFEAFVGGERLIPKLQIPLLLLLIFTIIMVVRKQGIKKLDFHLLPVLLYYILISDTGLYSAFIVGFLYCIIFSHIELLSTQRYIKRMAWLLIAFNAGLFCIKTSTVLLNLNERSHATIEQWISKNLNHNSKVIGSEQYYYACINNACDFQYIDRRGELKERVAWHKDVYKPDYIIINQEQSAEITNAYLSAFTNVTPVEIDCFATSPVNDTLINIFRKISLLTYGSYKGKLYKVDYKSEIIKPDQTSTDQ